MTKKYIIILYHGDCRDGFGGAWAAWKKFGGKAEYIAVEHHAPPPRGLDDKELYMVDFTYAKPLMLDLMRRNKRVTSIDHHETREIETKMTEDYSYAVGNSGCVLAWKYFHPKKPVPKLLTFIEDNDLWKFTVPHSREVFMYMQNIPYDFKAWNKAAVLVEKPAGARKAIEIGKQLLTYEMVMVEKLAAKNAELVEFEGIKTYAVNSPNFSSSIGAKLYKKLPPMAIVWHEKEGKIFAGLRSDKSVDVAKLAEKYGGGGHAGASAFNFPADQKKPWRSLNENV